MDVALNWI